MEHKMSLRQYLAEHLGNLDVISKEILNAFHGKSLSNQITKFDSLASSDVKYRNTLHEIGRNSKVEHVSLTAAEIDQIVSSGQSVKFIVLCDKNDKQIAYVSYGIASLLTTNHFKRVYEHAPLFKATFNGLTQRKELITQLQLFGALMFFDQVPPNEVEKYKTLSPAIKATKIKCIVVHKDLDRKQKHLERTDNRIGLEVKPSTNFVNHTPTRLATSHSYRNYTNELISQFNQRKIDFKLEKNKLSPATLMGYVQSKGYEDHINFMNQQYDFEDDRIRIRDIANKTAYVKYQIANSSDSFKARRDGLIEYYDLESKPDLIKFMMDKNIPPRNIKFILGSTGGMIHAIDVVYEYE